MGPVIMTVMMFIPFMLILWLANYAERSRVEGKPTSAFAVLSYVLLVLLLALFVFVGLALQLVSTLAPGTLAADPGTGTRLLSPEIVAALPRMGLGLWLPSLLGMFMLLPPVRRLFARAIPIDPGNTVHAVSLSYAMLILAQLLATAGLGLANVTSMLDTGEGALQQSSLIPVFWAQEVTWVLMAMVGVGLLSRRNLAQTLGRLSLTLPKVRQVAAGLGVGVGLAVLAYAALYAASAVGIGLDKEVEKLSELLIGPLTQSTFGILTLGVAAAFGEESIFRGALHPRFGLFLTALLFTLLHAQYGFSLATAVVFVVGLVLGWVRQRNNTSTSMIVHATYNVAVALLALVGTFGP
jgi:hypothetical protein